MSHKQASRRRHSCRSWRRCCWLQLALILAAERHGCWSLSTLATSISFRAYASSVDDVSNRLMPYVTEHLDEQDTKNNVQAVAPSLSCRKKRYLDLKVPCHDFFNNNLCKEDDHGDDYSSLSSSSSCTRKGDLVDFLWNLPANKLHILLLDHHPIDELAGGRPQTIEKLLLSPSAVVSNETSLLKNALLAWERLGNYRQDRATTTFHISATVSTSTSSSSRRHRRRKESRDSITSRQLQRFQEKLKRLFQEQEGWTPSQNDVSPDLSFQLVCHDNDKDKDEGNKESYYSLELVALQRIWPLPSDPTRANGIAGRRTSKRSSSKRVESFLVAKTANIQPHDVVWDPMCKRGTFLVEAAKYWPLGTYVGMDASLPHLEHARMNADSTKTRLTLLQGNAKAIPTANKTVDKILTCLPFGKQNSVYEGLLTEYSRILKPGGKMVCLINQASLPTVREASQSCCRIIFVRSPSFSWGLERAVLFIAEKGIKYVDDNTEVAVGLTDWERQSLHQHSEKDHNGNGLTTAAMTTSTTAGDGTMEAVQLERAMTIPPLVPFSIATRRSKTKNFVQKSTSEIPKKKQL